jgi:hypothetical protein
VQDAFGIRLQPEPIFIGHAWDDATGDAAGSSGSLAG